YTLVAAILIAYATTGFFLLNAATYFSHCASAMFVLGTVVCMLRRQRSAAPLWPLLAGGCVGLAMLCRVDSGLLAVIASIAAWLEQGRDRRTFLFGLLGAAPPLAVLFGYNAVVSGNPLLLPTMWAGNLHVGFGGVSGVEREAHLRILVQTFWRLGELADTASLLLPCLYVIAITWRIRTGQLRFYDIVPMANFILFLVFPDLGGFQMGPRYWFDGFVVMHITVASAFAQRPAMQQRFAVACALLLVPVSLARLPEQVQFQAHI